MINAAMCWLKSRCLSASTNYGDGCGTASLEANGSEHSACPFSSLVVPIDSTFISAMQPNNGHEFASLQTVPTDWTASFCMQERPLKSMCTDLFQGNVSNEQTMSPECQLGSTFNRGNLCLSLQICLVDSFQPVVRDFLNACLQHSLPSPSKLTQSR